MRKSILLAACFVLTTAAFAQKSCKPCEQLKDLALPDVRITKAEYNASDTISFPNQPWMPTTILTKPFCRVRGTISKEIEFELTLPAEWNGRFLMSGGGGFVGSIQNEFVELTDKGYATVGTDTGHKGNGGTGEWAYNDMERQLNFGHLAVHRTTVTAKAIIHAFYCAPPKYSYFIGCSRGGGQGMMEAQRYPDDYDGIVSGAPAFSWPAIAAKFVTVNQKNYPNPKDLKPVVTKDNLKLLSAITVKACDNIDGTLDNIIADPRKCKIDLSKLPLCAAGKPGKDCFTKEQLAVIKAMYEPVVIDQKQVYPGFPIGLESESGAWDMWATGTGNSAQYPSLYFYLGNDLFKYFVFNDSTWNYAKYDFKKFATETRFASSFLDATQTDYSNFRKSNGKLIFYHGWNDPALSAYKTIEHYDAVTSGDKDANAYMRLFLLPGVLHCGGGQGCDTVNWLQLIQDWVEAGKAPEKITAEKYVDGKVAGTVSISSYVK